MTGKTHFVMMAVLLVSGAAAAQPSTAPPQNCTPTRALPGDNGIATTKQPNQPLTDKLARSDGVLCPPPSGDTEMRVPAPPDAGASKMPVIRPPGSPGGDPGVRPK